MTYSNVHVGIGLTCVNALSDLFEMTSYRAQERRAHTIQFHEGKKIKDEVVEATRKDARHGLRTKMIPSIKYLGPTTRIPYDRIEEWILKISHFINNHTTIEMNVTDGPKLVSQNVYQQTDPIELLNDILGETVYFKPVKLVRTDHFEEEVLDTTSKGMNGKKVKKRIAEYGIMFAYDGSEDPCYDSYCNFTNTTEGGVHLDGVEQSLCNYLQKATKDSLTDREKEKIDILWADIRTGLKLVVYLNTDSNVEFEGNVKERIGSKVLAPIIRQGAAEEIAKFFEANPDKLKAITKIIKVNAKARIEANKVRIATTKESMTPIKELMIKNYDRAINCGKNDYRELFIVEGDSAKGTAAANRNPYFQAFYAVRGMTANPYKISVVELMDPNTGNKEWRELVTIMKCGIGKSFDLSKLYFDKIILLTDADIDGLGISSSICNFFINYLPGIVEAGKLYKALPPLYEIHDGNKKLFPHNKEEYVEIYRNKVIKNYEVIIPVLSKEKLKKDAFHEFLLDTVDYLNDLSSVADHYRVDKFLVERIAAFLVMQFPSISKEFPIHEILQDQKVITKMMAFIQKVFPEIVFRHEDCSFFGVAGKHTISIEIDTSFINKIYHLIPTYLKYGYEVYYSEKEGTMEKGTIGTFMEEYQKYVPTKNSKELKLVNRFKGLGEMTEEDLYATTLDPATRVLVRLTTNDLKKDLKKFDVLHGVRERDKQARKKLMNEFHIRPNDLDN